MVRSSCVRDDICLWMEIKKSGSVLLNLTFYFFDCEPDRGPALLIVFVEDKAQHGQIVELG